MNINSYFCSEIVGGNCPAKGEVPTLSHYIFWYILLNIGTMKTIELTQGKVVLVDDDDFEYLNQWKWFANGNHGILYAIRRGLMIDGKQKTIRMHRVIMNTPKNMNVDHIDGDGLNNQKKNLRNCTLAENNRNWRKQKIKTSIYKGVHYNISKFKGYTHIYIRACIRVNNKLIALGNFKTEESAARAYDEAAKIYFGEFANLNFKE